MGDDSTAATSFPINEIREVLSLFFLPSSSMSHLPYELLKTCPLAIMLLYGQCVLSSNPSGLAQITFDHISDLNNDPYGSR